MPLNYILFIFCGTNYEYTHRKNLKVKLINQQQQKTLRHFLLRVAVTVVALVNNGSRLRKGSDQ